MTKPKKQTPRVAVIEKALTIISFLERTSDGVGLTEIAKQTGVNKTTSYRILQTLMSDGIVEYGGVQGTYRLGLRLLQLGNIVQRRMNLRESALPHLKELTKISNTTTYLCLLNNNKSLCIERIEGSHAQILLLNVGDEWPLYVGAAPRAMLAYLDDEKIDNILSAPQEEVFTKHAHLTNNEFWPLIEEIREKGYSVSYEDVIVGVSSIGAPIFNHKGEVFASISLSNTSKMIEPKKEIELAPLVVNAAYNISSSLGWKQSK